MNPIRTLERMAAIVAARKVELAWSAQQREDLERIASKMKEMQGFSDADKFNRWFGYYQRAGEELHLWTLDEVIGWVREERDGCAKCPKCIEDEQNRSRARWLGYEVTPRKSCPACGRDGTGSSRAGGAKHS